MSELAYRVAELERQVAHLVLVGTVETLDAAGARVTVRSGGLLTAPLPWFTRRAGPMADWWAPEPGEQVAVFCPHGNPALGMVLPALYRDAYPAPAAAAGVVKVNFGGGVTATYDRATKTWLLDGGDVSIVGNVTVVGTLAVSGAITSETSVEDPLGTMQEMRDFYNSHEHPQISGVDVPVPQMT